MLGLFKKKPKTPPKPELFTVDQLKLIAKDTGRYIEVFYGDGTVVRIWEQGKRPEVADGIYY